MSGVVILETLRRHVTSGAFLLFLLLIATIAVAGSQTTSPAWVWPAFAGLMTLILGAQLVGPEFSSGTLQLILAKPVGRSTYLLSRVIGVLLAIGVVIWTAFAAEMIGRLVAGNAGQHVRAMLATTINLWCEAVLVLALLALIGSFTRAYFNIAVYLFVQFGLSMTLAGVGAAQKMGKLPDHPWIAKTLTTIDTNLFPDAPRVFDANWTLLVLSNAAVALVLACLLFRRREVPYGAD